MSRLQTSGVEKRNYRKIKLVFERFIAKQSFKIYSSNVPLTQHESIDEANKNK